MKRTLDDLCELITDGTHQTPEYCGEDGVIFLSSKDVVNRKINWEQVKYIPQSLHDVLSSRLKPQRNDILLAKNGTTGVAALVDCEKVFDIYVSLALLRPKKSINPKFLLHAINSPATKRQFDAGLKGIGVPNLHLKEIKNTTIDVPNENMQSHIVNCLETLDGLHENWIKQLAKLDTLVKSRFIEMFGDPMTNSKKYPLIHYGDVFELNAGGTPSKQTKEYWEQGTISWIGSNMCHDKVIYQNDGQYITKEGLNHSSAKIFPIDTVLIALVGATIGRTALLKFETATNQNVLGIRNIKESGYTPEFVFYYTQGIYDKFLNVGGGKFAMASKTFVSTLKIPRINFEEQHGFSNFVQQVDKSKSVLQKLLKKQELLRAALMQEYFG